MTKKRPIPRELRQLVFERDNYTCRYCGQRADRPHCDHVYPESRGGATELGNLVTACRKCNIRKHAALGVWPLPADFHSRLEALNSQIQIAERSYLESEEQRQAMEEHHGDLLATAVATIEKINLYNPLLISLGAAVLSLLLLHIGIEAGNPALLLTGVFLMCIFTVLSLAIRLAVRWIDREHAKALQALGGHTRHTHRSTP